MLLILALLKDHSSSRLSWAACWTRSLLPASAPPRSRSCAPRRTGRTRCRRRSVVGRGRAGLLERRSTWGLRPAEHAQGGESDDVGEADAHPEGVVHSYMITDNNDNCEIYCLMTEHRHIISSEHIVNFLAGLLGGLISVTLCNPLDIARSRLNVLVSFHSTCRRLRATRITRASIRTSRMRFAPFGRRKASRAFTRVDSEIFRISHQCGRHSHL